VNNQQSAQTRRSFLASSGFGLGMTALGTLLAREGRSGTFSPSALGGTLSALHHAPKAKRVIFLYMSGGPSHLETFDYKPRLASMDGQPMPGSFTTGQPIAQLQGQELKVLGPQFKFQRCGQSGQEIADILPYTQKLADEICIIRSMHTTQINHDPAHTVMNTGTSISGRPSMGSWINYGLGSEGDNLPGFVVMTSFAGRNPQPIASRQWHSGFLPGKYQGVEFRSPGDPIHFVRNPDGITDQRQRELVETVKAMDEIRQRSLSNPEIQTRIAQYELAFRMQTSIPELMDFSGEPKNILDLYGVEKPDGSFGANCLMARRMAERGVRFIQLYHRDWDHHGDLVRYMNICCKATDQPAWALVTDLKNRGMLDETLVIWGGEFGRTPMFQGKGKDPGRDHHIQGFSIWMAGGGIKPGITYGGTDELGYKAVEKPVHVHDLHATILHQLGIDHERLTYRYQGRDFRLTDVEGNVVREIIG
jgi:hypothetical protein